MRLEDAILKLLQERGAGKTICPSEVARAVSRSEDRGAWKPLMQPVRDAAQKLVAQGEIVVTQRGLVVDGQLAKGPVRLRLRNVLDTNAPRAERISVSMATKKKTAKKAAKKSGGQACWPGFKRVAGTKAGTKGSCEPKTHQTSEEKKADSRAAAARKRER